MKFSDFLEGKKEFNVAFLGGSITEGCGASKPSMRYSSQLVERLNKRLPDIKFNEINAGIGGTHSSYGMFRLKHDVLEHNPDILFVEFVANDGPQGDSMLPYTEGIVRTARKWNPQLPIVFLYVYWGPIIGTTRENPSRIIEQQTKIANAYGIPYVNMGYDLYDKILDYGGDPLFFTVDGGHPNDAGYNSYTDSIMRDLFRKEFSFEYPETPIFGKEFDNPRMILSEDIKNLPDGWKHSEKTFVSTPLKYIHSDKIGSSISFDFEGTECGIALRYQCDGGRAEITIDGKPYGSTTFFSSYGVELDGYSHFVSGLKKGKHTVTFTVSEQNDERSEGHIVRIGAILIA